MRHRKEREQFEPVMTWKEFKKMMEEKEEEDYPIC